MVAFPTMEEWTKNLFDGSWAVFLEFVAANSCPTTWTDDSGIMVQATAIYLEYNIRLVGMHNAVERVSWTTMEAVRTGRISSSSSRCISATTSRFTTRA